MKQELPPSWSEEKRAAGDQVRQAWEEFFSAREKANETTERTPLGGAEAVRIAQVRAQHESDLLRYPNVVAVSESIQTKQGKPTGRQCLVVYVKHKKPKEELDPSALLPSEIEGIPVDVVETGEIEFLLP